ncbi:hypothetical protein MFIFM68171_02151 [Madurella fahalii]|uniref:Uncharacterized protein n=1 Tax=Madurella fahalii TaxID=1157608 RepID=A0ABQ0G2F2_9PEZI
MAFVGPAHRLQGVYCHEHWTPIGYPLLNSRYDYFVQDCSVKATLTETYQAQTNVERQVSYLFEVPPEASVIGFTAQVGNSRIKAIVDEKNQANEKYQQAVRAGDQAWKLDKINDEVLQLSLGNVSPNSSLKIEVKYAYLISSDTLEDSVRLLIPVGLASRPNANPAVTTTIPTAPTGSNAVVINVGIETVGGAKVLNLTSLNHHASITPGFSSKESFAGLTPVQQGDKFDSGKAFVEFASDKFLKEHFVLVWFVPMIDQPRCVMEPLDLSAGVQGPETSAFALTLVSNVALDPEEQEYIFLIDSSGSMAGSRAQTAIDVVKAMLANLPRTKRSTFNIYRFTTSASSILAGGQSIGYDTKNVNDAIARLRPQASGGTNINEAMKTVLAARDVAKPRCSIIVITDGLDGGVASATHTVQSHATKAAADSKLVRVFVLGLGDYVSRSMCEALARAGLGATAYISDSKHQSNDNRDAKAQTLINSINRAPIRVRSVSWGMTPVALPGQQVASGNYQICRPQPNLQQVGAAAKGDNLPPPRAIQQAPQPGTMFWAIRSYWYAIIRGRPAAGEQLKVRILYDIPGHGGLKAIEVDVNYARRGTILHSLAARALIQTLEDKAPSITNPTDKYWDECEIVRLGKTYSLSSTQTSFVATTNGVGTVTYAAGSPARGGQRYSSGAALGEASDLTFVSAHVPAASSQRAAFSSTLAVQGKAQLARSPSGQRGGDVRSRAQVQMLLADGLPPAAATAEPSSASDPGADGGLSGMLAAQDSQGAFEASTVERLAFPKTGIPAVPAFLGVLEGRQHAKDLIWAAICAIAFLQTKHADRRSEWARSAAQAEAFVKQTLHCIFGVDDDTRFKNIFDNSLNEALIQFY